MRAALLAEYLSARHKREMPREDIWNHTAPAAPIVWNSGKPSEIG
jgi:hypothetical protein